MISSEELRRLLGTEGRSVIMAKKPVSISLLIEVLALFTMGCQDRGKAAQVRIELIDGVQHVNAFQDSVLNINPPTPFCN